MPCRDRNFEMFKICVTTNFQDWVVKYAQSFRKLILNSSGRCGRMRASSWQCAPRHDCHELPRILHEQLTSSLRVLHAISTNLGTPCHGQVQSGTNSSQQVYALHEESAHVINTFSLWDETFTTYLRPDYDTARQWRDVGVSIKRKKNVGLLLDRL